VAEQIAARGPLAVRESRRAALDGAAIPLSAALELEQRLFFEILQTDDVREGSRAWAERRDPDYQGR
jgi:enoyl-CoA hydratase/carnithine racemase